MKKIDIPKYKQIPLACGPTCLKMIFSYHGLKLSLTEIIKKIGNLKKYGTKTVKLAELAKKLGFKIHCYSYEKKLAKDFCEIKIPDLEDIIKFLKQQIPVIIAVNMSILYNQKPSNKGHFVVINGYDKNVFFYIDPQDAKEHQISKNHLMFAWYNNVIGSTAYLLVIKKTYSKNSSYKF